MAEYFEQNGHDFLDWANEYYSKNLPEEIKTKVEFNPVNEQEFLLQFSKLNATEVTVGTMSQNLPIQLNNLSTSAGSAQNEVLSNFFKSLLAKKG